MNPPKRPKMTATIFCRRPGPLMADSLQDVDVERPEPGPHDLLVSVRAVSVNPLDTKVRTGAVEVPVEVRSLGWDAAGVVDAVGEAVTLFRPGQRVWYAGSFDRDGSNAQCQRVDERIVGPMPESLGFAEAAAMPLVSLTAWQLLFDRLGVARDAAVGKGCLLIVGGNGGVGLMLIQLARRLTGLTVVATASSERGRAQCLLQGAHHVLNHHRPLQAQLLALSVPPVDHVAALSHTAQHLPALAELMQSQGRLAIIDDHASLDAAPFKAKSISLHWEMVFTRPLYRTPDMRAQHRILTEVAALVDAGVLHPVVAQMLSPMNAERLMQAHRLVEAGGLAGKVVVARDVDRPLQPMAEAEA
ncbi:zinc-binding alcohol dehydrogenase family protein [Frateuria aurantia DSM 6220]|uniref:Zinc-type alcohol dehydrogenase-like protein n=2 Tax=Frateuria aurantia TaxID=81475 RepID=H8L413_FRAAD|nr:zinc-binding alcohol dehydrogenase family protein [Frateuria aurantia DSM 6220]